MFFADITIFKFIRGYLLCTEWQKQTNDTVYNTRTPIQVWNKFFALLSTVSFLLSIILEVFFFYDVKLLTFSVYQYERGKYANESWRLLDMRKFILTV